MNPDPENFDSLRRLMALKRHEQPPPGYFDRFSRDVTARIKAGEGGGTVGFELPWLRRVLGIFEVKPIFAGAFGMAVCAFLISGVVSSETTTVARSGIAVPRQEANSGASLTPAAPMLASGPSVEDLIGANTNSLVPRSLFEQSQLQTEPVAYTIPIGH